jgi:large subunit ribosomal protein L15
MTVRFKKKMRKMRGSHTHGYGSKKKHRGGGSQGGKGFSGMHKHKFSLTVAHKKDFYGYKGFHALKKKEKTINVGELKKIANEDEKEIDLMKLGYGKLLSKGSLSAPITIKVEKFSKKAKQKVEKAGGKIIS